MVKFPKLYYISEIQLNKLDYNETVMKICRQPIENLCKICTRPTDEQCEQCADDNFDGG